MKSNLFRFSEGLLACPNDFDPHRTDVEYSSCKCPHYLQACTEKLSNMEGVVYHTVTKFRVKVMLNKRNQDYIYVRCYGF